MSGMISVPPCRAISVYLLPSDPEAPSVVRSRNPCSVGRIDSSRLRSVLSSLSTRGTATCSRNLDQIDADFRRSRWTNFCGPYGYRHGVKQLARLGDQLAISTLRRWRTTPNIRLRCGWPLCNQVQLKVTDTVVLLKGLDI